jgi:hypothetical protein
MRENCTSGLKRAEAMGSLPSLRYSTSSSTCQSMATLRISCTMDLQSTKSGTPYHNTPEFLY